MNEEEKLQYVSETNAECRRMIAKCRECDEQDCSVKENLPKLEWALETGEYLEARMKEDLTSEALARHMEKCS